MESARLLIGMLPAGTLRERRLQAGEAVFHQGDRAGAVFVVESGRVRLVRNLEDGSWVVLHVARAGETFAEAALFASRYHCDAVAETAAVVMTLPKVDLLAAMETRPQAGLAFSRLLASRVLDLRAQLEVRKLKSAPERILAWLRLRAAGDPPSLRLDRPWTAIAPEIGLTHEVIYRSLATLEREGRISRQRGSISLLRRETR